MKTLGILIFSISLVAIAQDDFTRIQMENSNYQTYSREELISGLGETAKLLPLYACNGTQELDPFWMPQKNEKGESLSIQYYKSDVKISYQQGKYYSASGREITFQDDLFVKKLIPVLAELEKFPDTAKLLRLLERSPYPLTIKFGSNTFNPHEESSPSYSGLFMANAISILDYGRMTAQAYPLSDIGSGGDINWNPKAEGAPISAALAHEMYHALDSVRGILDMRFVKGEGYEFNLASEYRAVFMENYVRKSLGVPLRTHYGNTTEGPGVLDRNGNSRFISSPCLK